MDHLSRMYKAGSNVDSILDMFEKSEKYALLDQLKQMSEDSNKEAADSKSLCEDLLLCNLFNPLYLKPALDLVLENSLSQKLQVTEFNDSIDLKLFRHVLKCYERAPLVKVDYTYCTTDTEYQCEDENVSVISPEKLPTNQHLAICCYLTQVRLHPYTLSANSDTFANADIISYDFGLSLE